MTTRRFGSRTMKKKTFRARKIIGRIVLFAVLLTTSLVAPAYAADAPTVTGVTPSGGPVKGGQVVVIKGSDFTGTTAVKFGAVDATSYAIVSDTNIVAVVPDAAAAGDQLIAITNATGTNLTGRSYKYAGPTVTAVSPAWATTTVAKIITVTGTGFTGALAADVTVGGKVATAIWVTSDRSMVVQTPINAGGDVVEGVTDVIVTRNSVASATGKSAFLFASGPPTVTAMDHSGTDGAAIGGNLVITGTQLLGVTQVNFGSTKVSASGITITSATSITVVVPQKSNGPVDVTVDTAAGSSVINLATGFDYFSTVAPTISSLYPGVLAKAAGGTFLVYGKGFTGVTASDVTLKCTTDITPTSVLPVSDTALIVIAPANASDAIDTCDLEIANPNDALLVTTKTDIIRYV